MRTQVPPGRSWRWHLGGGLVTLTPVCAVAQAEGTDFVTDPFAARTASLFQADQIAGETSQLTELAAHVLLAAQALAILAVVAGVVWKIQKERTQLQGLATALLTVAFIATVPLWRDHLLDATQALAGSIGFEAATGKADGATGIVNDLWRLVAQWVPPGSPYLDVLESQIAAEPASGTEAEWALRGWNWARGVGTAHASLLQATWQAGSGSLRAGVVFGICGLAVCVTSLVLLGVYLAEIVRQVLLAGGFALLPVFIAGYSLEAMRGQALRFFFGLTSIAFWPVGWALADAVSRVLIGGTLDWMQTTTTAALGLQAGVSPPALATAAPFVAWGALLLLFALTLGLCGWMSFTLLYIPVLISRAAAAGVGFLAGGDAGETAAAPVPVTVRTAAAGPSSPASVPRTFIIPRSVPTASPVARQDPVLHRFSPPRTTSAVTPPSNSVSSGARRVLG